MAASTLYVVRHGETEWSRAGRHTSTTDLPLTPAGEETARSLRSLLEPVAFDLVLTSPRLRARSTAALAGYAEAAVESDLVEWDYGDYEGVTTREIHEHDPDWTIWTGLTPGGETAQQVADRLDRVVERVRAVQGSVLVFGHGHALRALTARWLGLDVAEGRHFLLDTATVSVLGDDRGQSVVVRWNVAAS